ncbi:MAG: DNA-directed RNA polymerase subunit alpha [Candidatus Zambryskibacteria bacterium CG10_big_fil_rev_8_21_14_0_10_42_12]|uniref:DNA-directed RNA polymerase subunit alpha n=1 Tax=Candidatus Zambryskibacteria bacterium CG10_big_fil_rev_8_21_14_0_10_42_12 TaxID=1975115 RepID=A0A2H0QVR9_9BACT|nr:MAG: DNA-directed RNA polymerase subunit alpha [Candidatus Zambryskibacteria bacterium CG10_big_fil_rev_8_21_14_0_10_42_12]
MSTHSIILPSKPRIVDEKDFHGVYEIDGLYPGYGHTLGNSLRRIILSSLPGNAITRVKISGVAHEFSTMDGVEEDVITILLNLKRVRIQMHTDEPQTLTLKKKGDGVVTAKDIDVPGQVEIMNPEQIICHLSNKNSEIEIEMTVERGLGFVARDQREKEKVNIGEIALDANFSPIRRATYEVENMRVADRTDFNRLRLTLETDGTVTPREALEKSIEIMIRQLSAIIGFESDKIIAESTKSPEVSTETDNGEEEPDTEALKTRIEFLSLSSRTANALQNANIRTVGGLARKKEKDLLSIDGLGEKGIQEIKDALESLGITLKE